ncbi:unnamed protein product, partial [Leptidea sinapis]
VKASNISFIVISLRIQINTKRNNNT